MITHEDQPGKKVWNGLAAVGVGPEDEPVLAFDKVRWRGEPIVAVIGETAEAARAGAARVKVAYDPLPGVFDVEEAIRRSLPAVTAHWPRNHYIYPGDHEPPGSVSAPSRRRSPRPITSSRTTTRRSRSSRRRSRPMAASRSPGATGA